MTFFFAFTFSLLVIYTGLLLYYRFGWQQIPGFVRGTSRPASHTSITVLIPARNEEQTLPRLLRTLAQQTYPKQLFEVIVIDDHSTDGTAGVVNSFPDCKLITLKDFIPAGTINSYKKKAIEIGIQQSKGTLIVTTDADCYCPENWLQTIAAFYEENQPELIVMPVAIDCSFGAIEIFQALDFMTLQGITGASVYKNMHSMCNGANLAYTRAAFNKVKGFEGIDNIASGDDMLLMHKIGLEFPQGISYLKSADVTVQTGPVHTLSEFFNQRIRWASKADKYDDKRILPVLLLVYLLNVFLLLLPLGVLFSVATWWLDWCILLLIKTIAELLFLYPVAKFFGKQSLLWFFPLAQPFHILYTVIAGWLGKFGTYRWKGRKVK